MEPARPLPWRWSLTLAFLLTCFLTLLSWNTNAPDMWKVLTHGSDPLGYYQYLPGLFLDGSWDHLPYGHALENGKTLNLFTMGVALLQAPFFLLAWAWCLMVDITPSGTELPFVFARLLASCTYTSLGAILLLNILLKGRSWMAAAAAIATLLFGTTLYFYTVYEGGMSHAYSFFLMAWLVHLTYSMLDHPRADRLVALFVCAGLLVLIRPLNAVALLFAIFQGGSWRQALALRYNWLSRHPWATLLGVLLCVALWAPQFYYWKSVTGSWLVFTYGQKGEGFDWVHPHLFDTLFSYQNGWLIYTPVMAFAIGNLAWQSIKGVAGSRLVLLMWALVWYTYSSWWCWWLGGAFGYRGFIEYYAFLVFPLADVLTRLMRAPVGYRVVGSCILIVFVRLNIRLGHAYQYPWEAPDWGWQKLGEAYLNALW